MKDMIYYYNSDYPSEYFGEKSNFDKDAVDMGLKYDVAYYLDVAREVDGEVLELCCGSGRIIVPLVINGYKVTGVDKSDRMLRSIESSGSLVHVVRQNIVNLNLVKRDFDLCIIAFNSLLCVTNPNQQREVLQRAVAHLKVGGTLVLDVVNPLGIATLGTSRFVRMFTRLDSSGRRYTRYAGCSSVDPDSQIQEVSGWYDEGGHINRYSMYWRVIFKNELALMLESVGLRIESFSEWRPRMFFRASKT